MQESFGGMIMSNWTNVQAVKRFAILGLALVAMVAGGCASAPSTPTAAAEAVTASQAAKPHAECLVCKYDADLACVDVTVSDSTPNTVYDGKTYYFCSKSCCKKFEKDPAKYVNQK
jgi:YHS domain-containing protein